MRKLVIKAVLAILGTIICFANYYIMELTNNNIGIVIVFITNLIIGTVVFTVTNSSINNFIITVFSNTFSIIISIFTMIFSPTTIIKYEVILIFLVSTISINMPCLLKIFIARRNKDFVLYQKLLSAYFSIGYFILLYNLLFVSGRYGMSSKKISLVPFKTINSYLQSILYSNNSIAIINVVGNIVLFIPIGLIISIYLNNKILNFIILLLVPITIEIMQFITASGVTDIDDVILNFFGEIVGASIFLFIKYLYNKKKVPVS